MDQENSILQQLVAKLEDSSEELDIISTETQLQKAFVSNISLTTLCEYSSI